jgi:hypothetical protein
MDIYSAADIANEWEFCDDAAQASILQDLEGATIHFAQYEQLHYEGSAFVLFERDGRLYECNGSHCSCYGLEGQWSPEETSWGAIAMRDWDIEYWGSDLRNVVRVHQ